MKNKKLLVTFSIIVLLVIVAIGIFKNHQQITDDNVIRIGVILPLSGAQSQDGQEILNSLLLACDSLNQNRNEKIELVVEDSKDSPKEAITVFNKLQQIKPVAFIVGGSTVSMSIAPLGAKFKVPIICLLASDDALPKVNEWTFRFFPLDTKDAVVMAQYVKDDLKIDSIGSLWVNNEQGDVFSKVLKEEFEKRGGIVTSSEAYDIGAKDLKSEIEKVLSSNPAAIYVFGYGLGFVSCFNAIRQANYKGSVLSWAPFSLPFNLMAVAQAGEGVYYTAPGFDITTDNAALYNDSYVSKYSKKPGYIGAFGYESLNMVSPILQSGVKPVEIRDYISEIEDYNSIVGKIGFYGTRGLIVQPRIWRIENGKPKLLR